MQKIAVEAAEDHVAPARTGPCERRDERLVHIGEADAAPPKPEPTARRDAVEVRDLLDPRKRRELCAIDLTGGLHVAADAQHQPVRGDPARADVSAEPRELIDSALTGRQ